MKIVPVFLTKTFEKSNWCVLFMGKDQRELNKDKQGKISHIQPVIFLHKPLVNSFIVTLL